jgi:hypothetical protein
MLDSSSAVPSTGFPTYASGLFMLYERARAHEELLTAYFNNLTGPR